VASDLVGYRNVARPGVDAQLTPPGDAAALARALETALARIPEVLALVEAARGRADTFSLARLAERYLEIYDRARHTRPPGT
jgi:glycosyltransferase involved in cell wall biosynthesis